MKRSNAEKSAKCLWSPFTIICHAKGRVQQKKLVWAKSGKKGKVAQEFFCSLKKFLGSLFTAKEAKFREDTLFPGTLVELLMLAGLLLLLSGFSHGFNFIIYSLHFWLNPPRSGLYASPFNGFAGFHGLFPLLAPGLWKSVYICIFSLPASSSFIFNKSPKIPFFLENISRH